MIAVSQGVLALTLALVAGQGWAQGPGLSDPMRPPAFAAPATEAAGAPSAGAGLLQSTLLSKGRRIAMIDGKPMRVGDRLGAATIVAIDPASVTLREAGATRVLQLYQDVGVSDAADEKAVPRRPAMKERTK